LILYHDLQRDAHKESKEPDYNDKDEELEEDEHIEQLATTNKTSYLYKEDTSSYIIFLHK
jgi:hypothetical protein